jgi:hypothetical protein
MPQIAKCPDCGNTAFTFDIPDNGEENDGITMRCTMCYGIMAINVVCDIGMAITRVTVGKDVGN